MNITGEQYVRTLAQFIRSNERRLTTTSSPSPQSGHLSSHRRSDSGGSSFSMSNLWSFSTAITSLKPTISTASTTPTSPSGSANSLNKIFVSLDPHHLYYLLSRFSDLGLDVGMFEAAADFKRGDGDTFDIDIETSSITSTNSISSMSSAMSSLSLFSGWQGWSSAAQKNETIPINFEIQYIYRAFTRLTGLKLTILTQKRIDGFENWPMSAMLSLTLFKHLTHFEVNGLAPKMFDGWDILQEKLEYLSLQQGSIDDIYELFVDAVVDSMKRRKPRDNVTDNQITEGSQDLVEQQPKTGLIDYSPDSILPQNIWPNLKQVDLSDNSLTFVASEPLGYINKVITLDLSQNLLIAVPSGLSQLYNLQHLNLNNNMIESVTGIYAILGNVTKLELRNNRIENLCGLERLWSLEYIDIRDNRLMDWAEVGRMAELQEIRQIHVEGNPFTRFQPNYRLSIFIAYRENNKDIILDGSGPSYNERRHIPVSPKSSPSKNQQVPIAIPSCDSNLSDPVLSSDEQITKVPVLKTKKSRKFHKRVVKLDGGNSETDTGSDFGDAASITKSDKDKKKKKDKSAKKSTKTEPIPIKHRLVEVEKAVAAENDPNSRLRKKKSGRLRSNTIELSPKLRPSSPLSPRSDSELVLTPGEDYRRKVEELRTEGGSAWLRVLSEMEYAKGGVDRLREPPKMKSITDQIMANRDHS